MSLVSRISRLSYGSRVLTQRSMIMSQPKIQRPLMLSYRFGHHGPESRLGFPHEWGAMKWYPYRLLRVVILFLQFNMIGAIVWWKWDSIPYPAHRYNDENSIARNY
eukprot:CAMPEP_0197022372 /NCGR_PEP_ID=MMETSP1384-20130603/3286_1 /TAXON_ID=29189 /ORGANISM="Ammonia sp." /LENGTH=105 /DNA_ID=CAMNT_0042450409 /DNA_START=117 /DNA_END=434 /DNA_ORIENTATION=+